MRLPTRQDGVENRDKVYWFKIIENCNKVALKLALL